VDVEYSFVTRQVSNLYLAFFTQGSSFCHPIVTATFVFLLTRVILYTRMNKLHAEHKTINSKPLHIFQIHLLNFATQQMVNISMRLLHVHTALQTTVNDISVPVCEYPITTTLNHQQTISNPKTRVICNKNQNIHTFYINVLI
jgi:hypothetical protein